MNHQVEIMQFSKLTLVGGLVAINFIFPKKYWVSIIIPIDELIFFRGVETVAQPPTRLTCQYENPPDM